MEIIDPEDLVVIVDDSAETLMSFGHFSGRLWDYVSSNWRTKLIKTKKDYLLVANYSMTLSCKSKEESILIVARPVKDPDNIPKVVSIHMCDECALLKYSDHHVCLISLCSDDINKLTRGIVLKSSAVFRACRLPEWFPLKDEDGVLSFDKETWMSGFSTY